MSKTITISVEEYNDLLDDAEFLRALRMAGVDNWDGYDDAIDIYQSARGEQDEKDNNNSYRI